jgi:hypothetical protein
MQKYLNTSDPHTQQAILQLLSSLIAYEVEFSALDKGTKRVDDEWLSIVRLFFLCGKIGLKDRKRGVSWDIYFFYFFSILLCGFFCYVFRIRFHCASI